MTLPDDTIMISLTDDNAVDEAPDIVMSFPVIYRLGDVPFIEETYPVSVIENGRNRKENMTVLRSPSERMTLSLIVASITEFAVIPEQSSHDSAIELDLTETIAPKSRLSAFEWLPEMLIILSEILIELDRPAEMPVEFSDSIMNVQ